MRRLTPLVALIMILAMVLPVFAASPASVPSKTVAAGAKSYVVFMEGLPAVAYEGADAKFPATKPADGAKIDVASGPVVAYTDALTARQNSALAAAGLDEIVKVHEYTVAFNGFSALLTAEQAAALEKSPGVALVMEDDFRYKETDNSGTFLGLDVPGAAYSKGINGEDVVIGVIDTGIWPEHPSFADDGSYSELADFVGIPCEFGNTAHNADDAPFECNNKLIGARQMLSTYRAVIGAEANEFDSARDDDGHGSHTASTSAGNYGVPASIYGIDRGMVTGVAYRARVVAYKGLGELGGFGSDLAAAIDQAVADGVDVINYSIGGGPSLNGADDIAFLFAADAGVFAATSGGNSGPGAGTIGGPGSVPWITTVGASTQDRTFQGSASSSDGWEFFGASVTTSSAEVPLVDGADYGNELCLPEVAFTGDITGKVVLCKRGSSDRVEKSLAVFLSGGAGTILYNASDPDSIVTDNHWTPAVHISNADGVVIADYIAATADPVAQINGGVFTPIDAPWMAAFSSRGPNFSAGEDLIKPDITAPGVNILAAASPVHYNNAVQGELFQSISGTSMSSPHVAGLFALIKQVHPDWSAAMAKSALMTTAYQDVMKEDGVTPADPFDMGAGHVDPSGKPLGKHTPWNPGLVYDAGLFEYAAFTCGANLGVFTAGSCDFLEGLGIPSDASDLNLPSIGIAELAGSQTVQRTVTFLGKRGTFRAYVEAPPGYKVTVVPDVLRLSEVDNTATFEVTITSDGTVEAGEWSYGSLTWIGANKARIPIAVKGAQFGSPATVFGSGTDGSTSFDVLFGYSGAYTAAPHGLVADNVISDNVVQDPDQDFDPNDGFSNAHTFDLSGDAFFRLALNQEDVDDENVDIDLFLFDPNGVNVASSTSGGTLELIEILLPEDGTWTLFVHGWQTGDESSDYNLHSWIVSATPGGSLSLDSAPDEAVAGTTGTIDLSWAGLDPATHYLGAVSHSDDAGILGLTLVEVDTTGAPTAE